MNISFFEIVKKKHKKGKIGKAKKGKFVVVIPKNKGDRKLSVCKTIKYQLNIEKKVQGVFKN